jgi:hypothetical protein
MSSSVGRSQLALLGAIALLVVLLIKAWSFHPDPALESDRLIFDFVMVTDLDHRSRQPDKGRWHANVLVRFKFDLIVWI